MKKTIIGILTLSMIGIVVCISSNNTNTSALTYTEDVELEFTFNPSLSVSLSSSDLVINDLVPGTSSDSNVIDVNVVTNNISGYSLSSTVGNSTDSNPSHNTTNLVHSSNTSASSDGLVFTSLSPSDSLSSLNDFSPNTWGYSYSLDNGTNWSNYSGLPLYSSPGTTLSEKYIPSDDTVDFKIAAYASTTETAGAYTNKINFIAIAFPSPLTLEQSYAYFNKTKVGGYYTMQDMEPRICAVATEESELQVLDVRDNNVYWIAKLKDGKCWMTQGLDLDLAHDTILTHETSDIGWTENDTEKTWNPNTSTINFAINTASSWGNVWGSPYSASMYGDNVDDDIYIIPINNITDNEIYTSLSACIEAGFAEAKCSHYKVGNYYNFAAANAVNNLTETIGHTPTSSDNYTMMSDSICPAGWKMPHGLLAAPTESIASPNNSEFDAMLYAQGITPTTGVSAGQDIGYTGIGANTIQSEPIYIIASGRMADRYLQNLGTQAFLYSNTIRDFNSGYYLNANSASLYPAGSTLGMGHGLPVRCIAR